MVVRELVTRLGWDVDEAGLQKYNAMLDGAQKKANLIAGAGRLISVYVGYQATKAFVGLSAGIEQSSVAFETLLHDGEKAKVFLADLYKFAKDTPFGFFQLQELSKKMLAYGITAEQVIPMLTRLGDAQGALGIDDHQMMLLVRALGQIQTKGRAMTQEMNQLAENGIPAFKYLAEGMKTNVANAMKQVEDRAVTGADAIRFMMEGIDRDFGGGMAKRMKTLAGQWDRFKQNVQGFFIAMGGEEFRNPLTALFRSINEWMDRNEKKLIVVGKLFGQMLGGAVRGIAALVHGLGKLVDILGGVERVGVMVSLAMAAIGGAYVVAKIVGLIKWLTVLNAAQMRLWITNPYFLIGAAIAGLILLLQDLYVWFKGGKSLMGEMFGSFEDVNAKFEQFLRDMLNGIDSIIPQFWASFWEGAREAMPEWMKFLLNAGGIAVKIGVAYNGGPNSSIPAFAGAQGFGPPAMRFGGNGGLTQNIKIEIPVPAGTPAAQVDFLKIAADAIFNGDKLRVLANNPVTEQ